MGSKILAVLMAALCAAMGGFAAAQERRSVPPKDSDNPLTELISGYYFSGLRLRSMQDDDFDNPGFAWVIKGERLWGETEGEARNSCSSCHGNAAETMRGAGSGYPKFDQTAGKVVSLEQRVNLCRETKMKAAPWPHESEALLGMTAYVRLQSRGLPVAVERNGSAQTSFELGKRIYGSRIGQLGASCAHCHNEHYGNNLRAETLSQGHSNGFPAFQVKTQKLVSLHERVRACFRDMRAEPYDSGSDEMVALEHYIAWRGNGLPVETPAVRR